MTIGILSFERQDELLDSFSEMSRWVLRRSAEAKLDRELFTQEGQNHRSAPNRPLYTVSKGASRRVKPRRRFPVLDVHGHSVLC